MLFDSILIEFMISKKEYYIGTYRKLFSAKLVQLHAQQNSVAS